MELVPSNNDMLPENTRKRILKLCVLCVWHIFTTHYQQMHNIMNTYIHCSVHHYNSFKK